VLRTPQTPRAGEIELDRNTVISYLVSIVRETVKIHRPSASETASLCQPVYGWFGAARLLGSAGGAP